MSSFSYSLYLLSMVMLNADHKIIYALSSSSPPPRILLPPEAEAQIPIMINDIVDPLKVRMFRHGREDVVTGRPESIGFPEGEMPPLPIFLIPHLTDNGAGVVNAAECHSILTQGVGLPPLHVEVREPEGVYIIQDEVEERHGENRPSRLDLFLLIRTPPVFSSFPPFVF